MPRKPTKRAASEAACALEDGVPTTYHRSGNREWHSLVTCEPCSHDRHRECKGVVEHEGKMYRCPCACNLAREAARALAALRVNPGRKPSSVECPRCHQSMSARELHGHARKCPEREQFVFVPGRGMVKP